MVIGICFLVLAVFVCMLNPVSDEVYVLYYDAEFEEDYAEDSSEEEEDETEGDESMEAEAVTKPAAKKQKKETLDSLRAAASANDPVSRKAQDIFDEIKG